MHNPSLTNRRGAAAIEFALCTGALFGILFLTLDWGWWFFQRAQLLSATSEATRRAAMLSPENDPAGSVTTYVMENLDRQGLNTKGVTITATEEGASPSRVLTVDVDLPFSPLLGLWPSPARLSATRSSYLERQG